MVWILEMRGNTEIEGQYRSWYVYLCIVSFSKCECYAQSLRVSDPLHPVLVYIILILILIPPRQCVQTTNIQVPSHSSLTLTLTLTLTLHLTLSLYLYLHIYIRNIKTAHAPPYPLTPSPPFPSTIYLTYTYRW